MKGKLIVFEGTDGSGKATQSRLLCDELTRRGISFRKLEFPRYKEESSALIRLYLGGAFGDKPGDVNAYAASVFYSMDRYASYKQDWGAYYEQGGLLIADRYTTSNAVHQTGKLPPEQRDAFLDWLFHFEYDLLGLPEPTRVLYLDMPTEATEQMMRLREAATHTTADIHERDEDYLRRCRENAALGGNALGSTPAEQRERVAAACPALVGLIHQGHEIIISHGNGPQVGMIQAAFDTAAKTNPKVAPMPLPECTAMSQGYIGYHLQQGMRRTLRANGMPWQVATVVTQVVVDPDDPAFGEPTKPIGAFYDEAAAEQMMRDDPSLRMREDSGRGWRRVVASPKPVDIAERRSILNLLDSEYIVIACGGGGVPVVRDAHGDYYGVDAVIDKDFASACLAEAVGADYLFILTAVDHVCLNFGTPEQRALDELHVDEAETYLRAGQFGAGSMQPKVAAAVQFVRSGWRRRAVIASLEQAPAAMRGESGTRIVP